MKLTGKLHEKLTQALISAFHNKEAIKQMLKHKLDEDLDKIVAKGDLEDIAFSLVQEFEARSQILELVGGAREKNPNNAALKNVEEELRKFFQTLNQPVKSPDPSIIEPISKEKPTQGKTLKQKPFFFFLAWVLISVAIMGMISWLKLPNKIFKLLYLHDWTVVEGDFNGTTMVLVPAGSFMMGSENNNPDEKPVHIQRFDSPFWIDKTEVTRGAYKACNVCEDPPSSDEYSIEESQPINRVTWEQAAKYCNWRGARLPTEVEWEYAARGPDSWKYPWGNEFDEKRVHYTENAGNKTASVGEYPRGKSWVGALDMAGNVWEWTSSLYEDYPYVDSDGRELTWTETNENIDKDKKIVLRGGSFWGNSDDLRAADRREDVADSDVTSFGFRCARP